MRARNDGSLMFTGIGNPVRPNPLRDDREPLRLAVGGPDLMAALDHQPPHGFEILLRQFRQGQLGRLGRERYLRKCGRECHARLLAGRARCSGLRPRLGEGRRRLIEIERRGIAQLDAALQRGQRRLERARRIEVVAVKAAGGEPVMPEAGEHQGRLVAGILHLVLRHLDAERSRLAVECRLAGQAKRT